jgi:hypothetical protein
MQARVPRNISEGGAVNVRARHSCGHVSSRIKMLILSETFFQTLLYFSKTVPRTMGTGKLADMSAITGTRFPGSHTQGE